MAVASTAGIEGAARNAAYGASKGAVLSMVRALAVELAGYGIRANSIAPGWIATEMTQGMQDNAVFTDKVMPRVPMRRWGEPAEPGARPLRAKAGASVSQMEYARRGLVTPEMEYIASRENVAGGAELHELETVACPGAGACGGQFTANTMATAFEALGISPPGSSGPPATDADRDEVMRAAGRRVMEMVREDFRPSRVLPRADFENAGAAGLATGGSTNALLPPLAWAPQGGAGLSTDRLLPLRRPQPVRTGAVIGLRLPHRLPQLRRQA